MGSISPKSIFDRGALAPNSIEAKIACKIG
jgi:hypothetical protein